MCVYMCLFVVVCVWFGISEFLAKEGILVIFRIKGYFGLLMSLGKLVILMERLF